MAVADCLAASHVTGCKGAYTLARVDDSLHVDSPSTVPGHARGAFIRVESCVAEAKAVKPFC